MDRVVLRRRFVIMCILRRARGVLLVATGVATACSLNPRPEDPGIGSENGDRGGLFGSSSDEKETNDQEDPTSAGTGGGFAGPLLPPPVDSMGQDGIVDASTPTVGEALDGGPPPPFVEASDGGSPADSADDGDTAASEPQGPTLQ
jgi:hypothetical protein